MVCDFARDFVVVIVHFVSAVATEHCLHLVQNWCFEIPGESKDIQVKLLYDEIARVVL